MHLTEVALVTQNETYVFVSESLIFLTWFVAFWGPNLRILQLAVFPILHSTTVAINGYEAWSLMTQTCLLFTFHCSQFHKLNWSLKWFQKFYRFYKSLAWEYIKSFKRTIIFLISKYIWSLLDKWSQNAQHFTLRFSEGNCSFYNSLNFLALSMLPDYHDGVCHIQNFFCSIDRLFDFFQNRIHSHNPAMDIEV